MTANERVRKVVNWLIYQGIAANDRELSDLLGYTKTSFSQIVNGKTPLSDKFIIKLCRLDDNLNKVWIAKGEGSMFLNEPNSVNSAEQPEQQAQETITLPASAWRVIQQQADSLSVRDKQISDLIELIKEKEKTNAHTEDNATSAVVG